MARECLAAEPKDRPADAGIVAGRITGYLAGVQERLRAAELARAAEAARAQEAEAKAAAERRARRLTRALAATVLIAAGVFGAGWRWVELDRLNRQREATARVNAVVQQATQRRGQAHGAAVGDLAPWDAAVAAADKARDLLVAGVEPGVRKQVEELVAAIAAERGRAAAAADEAARDRRLVDRLTDIRSARADDRQGDGTDVAYGDAFREADIDVDVLTAEEAGRRIKARPAEIATALAMTLDDWAAVRRDLLKDAAGAARLAAVARIGRPRPVAEPAPRRPGDRRPARASRSLDRPGRVDRGPRHCRRSASTCWARPSPTSEPGPRPSRCLRQGVPRSPGRPLAQLRPGPGAREARARR